MDTSVGQVAKTGQVEHAEPRISQVWQSHDVFVIIKPKKRVPVWMGTVLAWDSLGMGFCPRGCDAPSH